MTTPPSQNLYGVGIGTGKNSSPVLINRDPTSHDATYPLLQTWYNTSTQTLWKLSSFASSSGAVTANWTTFSGPAVATSYVTDSGTATPALSILNIVGGSGVTTSGSGNTVTVSLGGGGTAIDSFVPDSGTSPVVPTAGGQVTMAGSGSITTVGGTNTLTTQLTGLTNHAVLVGAGTTTITKLAVGNTGELLVGATGADPAFGTSANGNFTFTGSTAGAARTLTVSQTDNTSGSSNAVSQITSGGASGGDAVQTFTVTGAQSWSHGIDNSASDAYVLAASTALGTTNVISASTAGTLTFPLQPYFAARLTTTDANVTGNGAVYTFGQGGNLSIAPTGSALGANGVFTVPADGVYLFSYSMVITGITAAMTNGVAALFQSSSSALWANSWISPAAARTTVAVPVDYCTISGSAIIPLVAGDTISVRVIISGGASDTADITGGLGTTSDWSGFFGAKIA